MSQQIPRIIHQIYFSQAPLPDVLIRNINHIKDMNPNWEHRLYDDAAINHFIASHYPSDYLDLYLKINPKYGAARADFFRYLLMYKCGGVYLDIKASTIKPLDGTIREEDRFLLAGW